MGLLWIIHLDLPALPKILSNLQLIKIRIEQIITVSLSCSVTFQCWLWSHMPFWWIGDGLYWYVIKHFSGFTKLPYSANALALYFSLRMLNGAYKGTSSNFRDTEKFFGCIEAPWVCCTCNIQWMYFKLQIYW